MSKKNCTRFYNVFMCWTTTPCVEVRRCLECAPCKGLTIVPIELVSLHTRKLGARALFLRVRAPSQASHKLSLSPITKSANGNYLWHESRHVRRSIESRVSSSLHRRTLPSRSQIHPSHAWSHRSGSEGHLVDRCTDGWQASTRNFVARDRMNQNTLREICSSSYLTDSACTAPGQSSKQQQPQPACRTLRTAGLYINTCMVATLGAGRHPTR